MSKTKRCYKVLRASKAFNEVIELHLEALDPALRTMSEYTSSTGNTDELIRGAIRELVVDYISLEDKRSEQSSESAVDFMATLNQRNDPTVENLLVEAAMERVKMFRDLSGTKTRGVMCISVVESCAVGMLDAYAWFCDSENRQIVLDCKADLLRDRRAMLCAERSTSFRALVLTWRSFVCVVTIVLNSASSLAKKLRPIKALFSWK